MIQSFKQFNEANDARERRISRVEREFKKKGLSNFKTNHKLVDLVWTAGGYKFVHDGNVVDIKKGQKILHTYDGTNRQLVDKAIDKFIDYVQG